MDVSTLKEYHGRQSSLIPFSSQYYLYFTSWDSTPTDFPAFSNLWLISPADQRILFADPPETGEIVRIYHDFDEIHGASISLDWTSEEHLQMGCTSRDSSYNLEAEFELHETLAARLLISLASSPPTPFRVSGAMVRASNFLLNMFITRGGATIAGRTETGYDWYNASSDWVRIISRGSAALNGEDLGEVTAPTWPLAFGDFTPYQQAVVRLGSLYIAYGQEPGSPGQGMAPA